jgi:hypothetical protein
MPRAGKYERAEKTLSLPFSYKKPSKRSIEYIQPNLQIQPRPIFPIKRKKTNGIKGKFTQPTTKNKKNHLKPNKCQIKNGVL